MTSQVIDEYEARDPIMAKYFDKVQTITSTFQYFSIIHIPQDENARADILSMLMTLADNSLGWTYVEYLEALGNNNIEKVQQVIHELSWMDLVIKYITDSILPNDRKEARLLKWRVSRFVLLDEQLHRKFYLYLLLKCLRASKANYILRKIHEGTCENHMGVDP